MIQFLLNNKRINIVILLAYYLAVVLPHEQVGLAISKLFRPLGRANYNLVILIGSLGLLIIVLGFLYRKILAHTDSVMLFVYFGITIGLMSIVNTILFVVNIESVHYLQYAVFAILAFPLIGNYYATLFWSTVAGAIDEAYQYFYLSPDRTDYYDFNDVITNFLGVAFGLLILKTINIYGRNSGRKFLMKSIIYPLLVLIFFFTILLTSNYLSIYPSTDTHNLVKIMPEGFWSTIPKSSEYHVVLPIEGLLILIGLFALYIPIFSKPIK